MSFQDIILKKRDGFELNKQDIKQLIRGLVNDSVPDYQISAWAMAVFFKGMTDNEMRDLAIEMAYSGDVVDLTSISGVKVDKHSTGGVGDKTTLVVLPIVAAAGIPVAKMSGRGLGHTGGTIDKFESIPGFQVELTRDIFLKQVNDIKAALISQTGNLVPADKRLYAIRDLTATIDSIPLIASSIMSKKIAAGADGIVLDVKVGKGAFMQNEDAAKNLAKVMIAIGRGAGKEVLAVISDMNQPLGNTIGNALEVKEAIDTLKCKGPSDLEKLCITLSAQMMVLGKKFDDYDSAEKNAIFLLKSGKALEKFKEIICAQNGYLNYDEENYGLQRANIVYEVKCNTKGFISEIDALQIGKTAMMLGAGRRILTDKIDYSVGIELTKKVGDYANNKDTIALIHTNDSNLISKATQNILSAYKFSKDMVKPLKLIQQIIN